MNPNTIIYILAALCLFMGGYNAHDYFHACPKTEPVIVTEYKDRVKTEIAYVPKETVIYKLADGSIGKEADADIDIKINKPELNVKVNEKAFAIRKDDDEKYIFEKNKLALTQTSSADLNITVPTVDKTKLYEIGIGVSKDGAVGLVGFPINRGNSLGGWVAGNEECLMGGVSLKF